jgi:hypothetical protein
VLVGGVVLDDEDEGRVVEEDVVERVLEDEVVERVLEVEVRLEELEEAGGGVVPPTGTTTSVTLTQNLLGSLTTGKMTGK